MVTSLKFISRAFSKRSSVVPQDKGVIWIRGSIHVWSKVRTAGVVLLGEAIGAIVPNKIESPVKLNKMLYRAFNFREYCL